MRYIDLDKNHIKMALELVWRVFMEYEAPDYSDEGVEEFRKFIMIDNINSMYDSGRLVLYGCYDGDTLAGMLAIRDISHICMLFVDKQYHRRGIATRLFEMARIKCIASKANKMTVNSSPYAVEFYHSLGYTDRDTMQEISGIKYVPMVLNL